MLKQEQINGKVLNHLGLVMAAIKKIGIIDKVDKRLAVSVEKGAKITMIDILPASSEIRKYIKKLEAPKIFPCNGAKDYHTLTKGIWETINR